MIVLRAPVDWVPLVAFVPVQSPAAAQDVALVVLQESVDALPWTRAFGVALSARVGGGFGGATFTVTDCDPDPPAPVQVSTNVVVEVRPDRASEPLSALVPLQPPDAVQAVAFDADQASVVLPPFATLLGAAVRLTEGGGGDTGGETETVTDCDAVAPPLPLQVSVNVVVVVSPVLASEPLSAFVPAQPPAAVQLLALAVDQLRVDVPPFATAVGDAVSEIVGEGGALGGVTVTVTDCDAVPPAPVHDNV